MVTQTFEAVERHETSTLQRWAHAALFASSVLVVAFVVSLIVRSTGSNFTPVDGWGVSAFELSMGVLCMVRYFDRSWRSSHSATSIFPLVLGWAVSMWAIGDLVLTMESLGGGSPGVPSLADGFYLCFFPVCYLALMVLIRRGNNGSLLATSLDGLIAGLAVAGLSGAFLFGTVANATGAGNLSTAVSMAYPVGDVLLLVLAVGAMAVLPRHYRLSFAIVAVAMATNVVGDMFNLLQPDSKIGYITNASVWPISLLLLATAAWVLPANAARVPKGTAARAEAVVSERSARFTIPALGTLAGLVVVGAASLGIHESQVALAFAAGTLLMCGLRLWFSVRESQSLNTTRFRSLIENSWDLIVVADAEGRVAYITKSAQRVLGYEPADFVGHPLSFVAHPDDAEAMGAQLRALTQGATRTAAFETRMRHRNGEWRTIAWTATDLLDDPAVRGYVLNGGDVTEARQATEDLAAARDGALQASRAKSDFLSTMSHEIRTPMNGVIGLTDLLLATALDDDQHELASGVKVSAENLLVIINDILDFSKIEAGKLEIEEVPFDVTKVADDVGRILAGTASAKGIELLVDVHPDVPSDLLGDGVRIQQVLLNLGSNAVKFTSEGEVVIRIRSLPRTSERVALRFEVIDMGIGIAPTDLDRLFRPFAQADSSTTRKYGGTGLGLAICRQLVELMGGQLGCESTPGEGSTFWFELSLGRGATATRGSIDEPRRLEGKRALVVDDNATNRKILRQQMTSWSVTVSEAADADEAIELARRAAAAGTPYDIGVLDLNMPGTDGIELAGMLRAEEATSSMLLFLLSSSGDRLSAAESHLRGFCASLTKPVRPSELFDCLITSLNHEIAPTPRSRAATTAATQEGRQMILLVEDNTMNQLVGSKVLAKLGYDFEIANHGGEAVSAMTVRTFDAVLMDCQMPEMDGYQATAAVRQMEGAARHTPIIAMTAGAMEGDREACLAAGMDDYITKPIRPEAVAEVLERWLGDPVDHPTADPRGEGTDRGMPLDPEQIALLLSLDDGEGAVLAEIIEQYLAQTWEGRGELVRVIDTGDVKGVERAAHALRGASANIGAKALASVCEQLEANARESRVDATLELVGSFDAEFARVSDALSNFLVPSS